MSENGIARVNYFDQQYLRTQDFQDEQAYHLVMHRRHNIAAHIWGIVYGLQVEKDKEGSLRVLPGIAVDGYGRELILPYPQTLSPDEFDDKLSEELDVWLIYTQQPGGGTPLGYEACQPKGTKANGKSPGYRMQELGKVVLRRPNIDRPIDPSQDLPMHRQPEGVPPQDVRFDPTRQPPDQPERSWPVFLGQIRRIQTGDEVTFEVDLNGRPYAGLVGELIRAPSGLARVQIGAEAVGDDRRFAVYLLTPGARENPPPRLSIDKNGNLDICGNTRLYGDLMVDGGVVEFGVGPAYDEARPWSVYHTTEKQEPATVIVDEDEGEENAAQPVPVVKQQLRIEMKAPLSTALQGTNEVVIGSFSAKESRFKPCLTVSDDCSVTVHGNLILEGLLKENAAPESGPILTQDMQAFTAGALYNSLLDALRSGQVSRSSLVAEGATAEGGEEPGADVSREEGLEGFDLPDQIQDFFDMLINMLEDQNLLPAFLTYSIAARPQAITPRVVSIFERAAAPLRAVEEAAVEEVAAEEPAAAAEAAGFEEAGPEPAAAEAGAEAPAAEEAAPEEAKPAEEPPAGEAPPPSAEAETGADEEAEQKPKRGAKRSRKTSSRRSPKRGGKEGEGGNQEGEAG